MQSDIVTSVSGVTFIGAESGICYVPFRINGLGKGMNIFHPHLWVK